MLCLETLAGVTVRKNITRQHPSLEADSPVSVCGQALFAITFVTRLNTSPRVLIWNEPCAGLGLALKKVAPWDGLPAYLRNSQNEITFY